jgi:hypothetical protein
MPNMMDFSNAPAYPLVANTQYSPNSEAFPSPDTLDTYFTDMYAASPDYAFSNYYDNTNTFYDRATPSQETAPSWSPHMPKSFPGSTPLGSKASNTINTNLNAWSDLNATPLPYPGEYNEAFTVPSPASTSSRHGSPASTPLSQNSTKHSHSSPSEDQKPPHRPRGRPRLS